MLTLVQREDRPVGGRLALHSNSFYVQDGTQTSEEDADYTGEPQVLVHNQTQPGDE